MLLLLWHLLGHPVSAENVSATLLEPFIAGSEVFVAFEPFLAPLSAATPLNSPQLSAVSGVRH